MGNKDIVKFGVEERGVLNPIIMKSNNKLLK